MERMGTEYQKFNGKEYVSLRRFWNIEGKYKTEKAKNIELEEENKKLKEELAEQYDGANGLHDELRYWKRECKKLKERIEALELCIDID